MKERQDRLIPDSNFFFDIDVKVYSLSTKAPVKERLSNPYSSIFGLNILGSVCKDLIHLITRLYQIGPVPRYPTSSTQLL